MESRPPLVQARGRGALELGAAVLVSGAFAASLGLNFGVGNQLSYLLPSLRLLDPTLLTRDWFATETTLYHPLFSRLGALLLAADPRGAAVALSLTLVVTLAGLVLYALARVLAGASGGLAAFFLTMSVELVRRTTGPATTYVFDGTLQPSTLSSAFFLAAATLFVAGRLGWAGALLAVSGLWHVNLLLLTAPAFALAVLLAEPNAELGALGRRLLHVVGPTVVPCLFFLPMLLQAVKAVPNAELARHVFTAIRAPHHFVLRGQLAGFLPLVGWQILGGALVWPRARAERGGSWARAFGLIAGILAVVWAGTAAGLASEGAASLFAWRLAPHAELLLVVTTSAAAVQRLLAPDVVTRLATRRPGIATRLPALLALGAGALCLNFAVGPVRRIPKHSSLLQRRPAALAELETWMRERSPKQALFLTPPDEETLRFWGQRAIVVDWKGAPALPGEVLGWYRRIEDVVGRAGVTSATDLSGYDELDPPALRVLKPRYGIDYVVVRRPEAVRFAGYERAFENARFVVLAAAARATGERAPGETK